MVTQGGICQPVDDFVSKYGGVACYSLDDLLASDIDAVYIATLPDSHAAFTVLLPLRPGSMCLCEKPATVNLAELDEPVLEVG